MKVSNRKVEQSAPAAIISAAASPAAEFLPFAAISEDKSPKIVKLLGKRYSKFKRRDSGKESLIPTDNSVRKPQIGFPSCECRANRTIVSFGPWRRESKLCFGKYKSCQ